MAGVPGNNGDSAALDVPGGIKYTIPTGLPSGPAVLAWTWFNVVSPTIRMAKSYTNYFCRK